LVEKGYWVYVIGTKEDYLEASNIYGPEFKLSLQKDGITNLMGSLSMFEAIDFVMNKSDFVLSCCSWSGWYGIASRTKTAMTLGPLMEEGAEDRKHVCLMKNKDVFFMDYSSKKEEADNNIAEWIKQNA